MPNCHYNAAGINRLLLKQELEGAYPGDDFTVLPGQPGLTTIYCSSNRTCDEMSTKVTEHDPAGVPVLQFSSDGHSVGIGTATPDAKLRVFGSFKVAGGTVTLGGASDDVKVGASSSLLGFFGSVTIAQPAATVNLTDSTSGTANNICVDVASIGIADPAKINDNFADCIAKVNAILTALRNLGLIAS